MVADVTVTRLADDRFRVVTGRRLSRIGDGLAAVAPRRGRRRRSSIRDVTGDLATIGLWGPRARDVLVAAGAPADEVGNDAIPMRRARAIAVGPAPVHAARISYAGELGWELTMPIDWAVTVWDRLRTAGAEFGLEPDRLSSPRGPPDGEGLSLLRHRPDDARHPVRGRASGRSFGSAKGPFIGREALAAADATGPDRRLRTLVIGGAAYEPVYGGEAVRLDGEVVGRLRSVAYGPTVERTIGYAYLSAAARRGHRTRDRRLRPSRHRRRPRPTSSSIHQGDRMRG